MATFRGQSHLTKTGDIEHDVSDLRNIIYELNEELRYIFQNLGPDNFNQQEYHALLESQRGDMTEYADQAAEEMKTTALATVNSFAATIGTMIEGMDSLNRDISALQDAVRVISGNIEGIDDKISNFEEWEKKAVTKETKSKGWQVTLESGETTEIIRIDLALGTYFVTGRAEITGEDLSDADLNLTLLCRGVSTTSDAVDYRGVGDEASMVCSASFTLSQDGYVALLASHVGDDDLYCTSASISAVKLE